LDDIKNNIESYVGSTETPMGISWPTLYNENERKFSVLFPRGTLEGASEESMNRGAKAISNSGGFTATVGSKKMQGSMRLF
jgi:hydroxymethylglutaryl-CoA reductase (NADPH)